MYTRNRQSQGYGNVRNQSNANMGYQGPNTYNQQGNFQPSQPPPNQNNYKQGNTQNSPAFKPQPQQQAQLQQHTAARNVQQQMKPQLVPPQQQPQQQQPQQQQPQQQQQQQQQQYHQQQLQQQQQQPPTNMPQPQRLKPILKQTSHSQQQSTTSVPNTPPVSQPAAPSPTPAIIPVTTTTTGLISASPTIPNNAVDEKLDNQAAENTDVDMQDQQPRWRRKVPGFRVNKRLKRLRLNQRLRKTLQPKNAIMVLNEMKAGVQFTFPETQGPMPNSLYLVHAELDGKTYVGQGLSKPLARQNAAENALKALLLEKMTAASLKARIDAETDGQINQTVDSSTTMVKDENNEESGTPMDTTVDESDEIPWSSLASFALYKLFLEWHNQGTSVPVPRPGLPSPVKGAKKDVANANKTTVQKELPPNATSIHPVMLLNQMRPGLTYVELNRVGNPPNTMFTLAVDIDGVEFTGTAKNKKDAKKVAAKSALLALYGLTYPDEVKQLSEQIVDV